MEIEAMSTLSETTLSSTTEHHLMHSTTTTTTVLPNKQHRLTSTITSMVHTDAEIIQKAILTNLPHFIDQSNPKSNPTGADDTPMETATFAFVSLLTVDKTASGKPVKKLFSFDLQVDIVSSNELCTELAFATIPGSPHDDSTSPALVEGTIVLNPQSADTTRVTLTAEIVVVPEVKSGASGSFTSPATGAVILSHVTNSVLSLHIQYARYEQVDAAMYKQFEEEEMPNAPDIQPHEDNLVERCLVFGDDSKTSAKFKRIKVSEREAIPNRHTARQREHNATSLVQQLERVLARSPS